MDTPTDEQFAETAREQERLLDDRWLGQGESVNRPKPFIIGKQSNKIKTHPADLKKWKRKYT